MCVLCANGVNLGDISDFFWLKKSVFQRMIWGCCSVEFREKVWAEKFFADAVESSEHWILVFLGLKSRSFEEDNGVWNFSERKWWIFLKMKYNFFLSRSRRKNSFFWCSVVVAKVAEMECLIRPKMCEFSRKIEVENCEVKVELQILVSLGQIRFSCC